MPARTSLPTSRRERQERDRETAIGISSDIWLVSLRRWICDGREFSLEAQVRCKVALAFRGLVVR